MGPRSSSSWRSSSTAAMGVAALLLLALLAAVPVAVDGALALNYYKKTCPSAEAIVRKVITSEFKKDRTIAAGLVRVQFHDAFVEGADASLLIDGAGTEQTAPQNTLTHGYDSIDAAKAAVEKACPGVVSCADILNFATRDVIWLSKGPFIRIKGGRRDGRISQASRIGGQIPGPNQLVPGLTSAFSAKGLSQKDLVVLSGAHTIGKARCATFQNRLFTSPADPNLNSALAAQLRQQCPQGQNQNNRVDMDSFTPNTFDNLYYTGLTKGLGIFTSDDDLVRDPATSGLVKFYATKRGGRVWSHTDFPASFVRLTEVGVKTGSDGEIRKLCGQIN